MQGFSSLISGFTGGAKALAMKGIEHWAPGKNQAAAALGATGLCPAAVAHTHGFDSCCSIIDGWPGGGGTAEGIADRARPWGAHVWSISEQLGREQGGAGVRLPSEQATPAILLFHRARYASFSLSVALARWEARYEESLTVGADAVEVVGFQQGGCEAGVGVGASVFSRG